MSDGTEPPHFGPGENLSKVICRAYKNQRPNTSGNRPPPQTSQIAYVELVEPNGSDYDGYISDMHEASPVLWQQVYAAEHTEKTRPQFNPIAKEQWPRQYNKQNDGQLSRPKPTPYVKVQPVPKQWGNQGRPLQDTQTKLAPELPEEMPKPRSKAPKFHAHTPPKILKSPRADNPSEHHQKEAPPVQQPEDQAGSLKNQPDIRKSNFVMKGNPRIPNPGPEKTLPWTPAKNRFTTTMHQCMAGNDIYQKVLRTDITLPLGELLAVCLDIEKTLSNDTRLRTAPIMLALRITEC
jgi:hypothetical protein